MRTQAQPHDYNYIRHGADWGGLGSCGGNAQSPIDILTAEALDPSERSGVSGVSFNDLPSAELTDVKVNLEQDMKFSFSLPEGISLPTITIDGTEQTFKPLQVHFHHFSSEHTVDGMAYPLESHLVMQSNQDENQLAVLGIFYRYGEADPFLTRLQDAARGRVNQGGLLVASCLNLYGCAVHANFKALKSTFFLLKHTGNEGISANPDICLDARTQHLQRCPRVLMMNVALTHLPDLPSQPDLLPLICCFDSCSSACLGCCLLDLL